MKTGKNLLRSAALALALALGLAGGACAADIRPVETDPQQLETVILSADEPERHHHAMVEIFVSFPENAGRKTAVFTDPDDLFPQFCIIPFFKGDILCPKLRKGTAGFVTR